MTHGLTWIREKRLWQCGFSYTHLGFRKKLRLCFFIGIGSSGVARVRGKLKGHVNKLLKFNATLRKSQKQNLFSIRVGYN